MIQFCPDKTEVFFSFLEKAFTVSSVFCEIQLPFMESPVTIRWYGVIIAFGFTLAVLFGGRLAYVWKIDINKMIDVLIYGAFCGIIGARAYYVISEWDYYGSHPSEILMTWHGGLAIYGGLIGGLLAAFIVCKVEKINILNLLDLCGMSFLIGQGIGRWGNFANQEAFGVNTDLPWGMYSEKTNAYLTRLIRSGTELTVDPSAPVHPTFLYESLWCLLSFLFIYLFYKKFRKFSGQLFLLYGILYGAERAFVEGLRTDSLYIGDTNLRISQLLSIALVAVCGVLFVIFTIKYTKDPKPIEGIDFYTEIPVYNKKKAAFDTRIAAEKLEAELAEMKKKTEEEKNDYVLKAKYEKLEKKTKEAREKADKAMKAFEESEAKKEAKRLAKASRRGGKETPASANEAPVPAEEEPVKTE